MALDLLTFGEPLAEVMRTHVGQPLDQSGAFTGPHASGAPFIFAVQAARLGAKVSAVGCVGDDAFGRFLMREFADYGLDMRGVHVLPTHATGVAFIAYAPDGSRDYVFHMRDAAPGQLKPNMLDEALFDGLKCLHLTGSALSINDDAMRTGLRALELASRAGAKISFDPNIRPQLITLDEVRDAFAPFVEAADVIMPTEEEAMLLTDEISVDHAVHHLLFDNDKPERVVVVTGGEDGCVVYTSAGNVEGFDRMMSVEPVDGFQVEEIDPTGAGDCFDAGFLVRWLAGDTLYDAARFANACGALAVTRLGPMAGARTLDEVQAFLDKQLPNVD
jgi:tagatose kinase